jgi:hypothetical protein
MQGGNVKGSRAGSMNRGEEVVQARALVVGRIEKFEKARMQNRAGRDEILHALLSIRTESKSEFSRALEFAEKKLPCLRVQRNWTNDGAGCVELSYLESQQQILQSVSA